MASWHKLPAEIRLMILKVTADSKPEYEPESRRKTVQPRAESSLSLAALATVSREWQHHFEGVKFRRLTLTPVSDTFHMLSSIVSGPPFPTMDLGSTRNPSPNIYTPDPLAGNLAKNMPKLKALEIWNGMNPSDTTGLDPSLAELVARDGFRFIFRYLTPLQLDAAASAAATAWLGFESSWDFTPSKAVLAVWEEVAAAQHSQLEVFVDCVEDDEFNTGLAVMEKLATRGLVVSKRTWDEMQAEGRTGPTAPLWSW